MSGDPGWSLLKALVGVVARIPAGVTCQRICSWAASQSTPASWMQMTYVASMAEVHVSAMHTSGTSSIRAVYTMTPSRAPSLGRQLRNGMSNARPLPEGGGEPPEVAEEL